jgi:hypothetical protein
MATAVTAPVAGGSLVAGYLVARESGVRQLGALPLAAGLAWCLPRWRRSAGPAGAAALTLLYVGGFGASHPLARRIGAWQSVLAVAAIAAGGAWAVADRRA